MPRLIAVDAVQMHRERVTALRYLAVTVAGYFIDLGISLAIVWFSETNLAVAAAMGFASAVLFNYLAHEFWTFSKHSRGSSYAARFAKYALVCSVTLATRLGVIGILQGFATTNPERTILLIGAAGVSVILNYLLTRFAVFSGKPDYAAQSAGRGRDVGSNLRGSD